jgi:hypothetical protein
MEERIYEPGELYDVHGKQKNSAFDGKLGKVRIDKCWAIIAIFQATG